MQIPLKERFGGERRPKDRVKIVWLYGKLYGVKLAFLSKQLNFAIGRIGLHNLIAGRVGPLHKRAYSAYNKIGLWRFVHCWVSHCLIAMIYLSMRLQRKLLHNGTFKVTVVLIPIRSYPPWQRIIGVIILWFFSWTDYHTFFLVNDNNWTIPLLSIVDIIFYFIFYFHLLRHVNKYVITCSKFYKLQAKSTLTIALHELLVTYANLSRRDMSNDNFVNISKGECKGMHSKHSTLSLLWQFTYTFTRYVNKLFHKHSHIWQIY